MFANCRVFSCPLPPSRSPWQGVFGAQCSHPAMSIIGAEDEDFENDLNDVVDDQCKYFDDIEKLKDRPTHLLVFMQHVFLQFDPAPMLCYLHAELFRTFSTKETKKQFVEFYNTFLDKGAVTPLTRCLPFLASLLTLLLPVCLVSDRIRPDLLSEDTQKRYAQEVQSLQAAEVAKQLEDFRQKRMMGMTPNEAELIDVESHYPTDQIMKASLKFEQETVAFYMKHLGVKTRAVDSKKSRGGFFRRQLVKVKTSISMARSESARVDRHSSHRRGTSRAKQSRSRSDVDLQPPSTTTTSPSPPSPQLEEVEPRLLEFEHDPPNWRDLASPEALPSLGKKETKRQEVINELFATEHAHVRMLSVLQMVFSKPLEREELLTSTELAAIFPNLDEIIDMHYNFYENLKKLRLDDNFIVKSISTTVLNRFGGTEGDWFQKLTARFCSHQSWALVQIKSRQKKEPRFNSFIQEAESKPQCRRLQLKDIIPIEMQRLTKYPLLLENIAKNTDDLTEKERIQQSAECCRKILNHVNEEVKVMENLLTLKDYQRRLDTSGLKPSNELYTEYKNVDLTQKKMLYEGPLTWRVTKEKGIEVQCVLLGDLLVLLQRQDDKMVLKCQSKSNIAVQEGKQMLSPIIKLDSVFLREVATDRKAFYVIFTWDSGAQIYELVAQSVGERKMWVSRRNAKTYHVCFLMSLKRLLVGSISLSEDSQPDEENGEDQSQSPNQEMDSCQSTGWLLYFPKNSLTRLYLFLAKS
uniref:Rho guanine nucleotide exchange factor (GEF) 1 n=1 Tax=Scophthalmus maximus TaxID=52904 RepID=A0A8D3CUV6_SCOMX